MPDLGVLERTNNPKVNVPGFSYSTGESAVDIKVLHPLGYRRLWILKSALLSRWTLALFFFFKETFHITEDKQKSKQKVGEAERETGGILKAWDIRCNIVVARSRVVMSLEITASYLCIRVTYHLKTFYAPNVWLLSCSHWGVCRRGNAQENKDGAMCAHQWNIYVEVLRTLRRVEHKQQQDRWEKSPRGIAAKEKKRSVEEDMTEGTENIEIYL